MYDRSRSTTSPSRIFTVPDDCSTDENEPMEEDVPMLTAGPTIETATSTLGTADAKKDSHTEPPAIPQLDGLVDTDMDTTIREAPQLVRRPDATAMYTVWDDDNESIRLTESSYSTSGYSSPSSPGSPARHQSVRDLFETAFMTFDEDDSGSEFWGNNSVDEADEDTNSHSSCEEDSIQEGVFIYDSEESDELDCEPDPMEALGPEELPEVSEAPDSPSFQRFSLPPIHQVLPWASGFPHRVPSPSDAVFPYAPRCPGGEEFEAPTVGVLARINHMGSTTVNKYTSQGEVSVHTLGQISGKPDFFQAREYNKMALAQTTMAPQNPTRSEQNVVARDASMEPSKQDAYGASKIMIQSSSTLAPSSMPRDPASSWPTPLVTQPSQRHDDPGLTTTVDALDFADFDPASAWELQQFKNNQAYLTETRSDLGGSSTAEITDATQSKHAAGQTAQPVSDSVMSHIEATSFETERQQDNESLWGSSDSALSADQDDHEVTQPLVAQTSRKGKRKADEISSLTEAEMTQYNRAELSIAADAHAQLRHLPLKDGPKDSFNSNSRIFHTPPVVESIPADSAHSTLPSPPTTPDGQVDPGRRPNKRIKRIAERVGFAALGGATVGALVLSSLIYTAPNFV